MKISRNTVKKCLKSSDPPQFQARDYAKISDPYADDIRKMIKAKFIGARIREELVALGFAGALSAAERMVHDVKQERERSDRIATRAETPPGRQMQCDWKEWELPVNGKTVMICIHEAILGFSRKKRCAFSLSIAGADVVRAIREALIFYGGVPLELVMDNAKQMVVAHERSGAVLYNDAFLRFTGLMGIDLNPCRNYRARTKGKAERPFCRLQERLLRGCEAKDLSEFSLTLAAYMEKANGTIRSAMQETPDERFERERDHLKPLPMIDPALMHPREIRGAANDGCIPRGGSRHPVPMDLALKSVLIEPIFGRMIRVYDEKGNLAAALELSPSPGRRPVRPEREEMNRACREKKEAGRSAVVKAFIETFPDQGDYMEALRKARGANLYARLREIVSCVDLYPVEEASRILHECMSMGAFHKNTAKRLLASKALKAPVLPLSGGFAGPAPLVRNIAVYREAVHE